MNELVIPKSTLLAPLLTVAGAVDRKQSLPVLANILMQWEPGMLRLIATDLEIEITAFIALPGIDDKEQLTVSAKKLVDIVRSFDESANPVFKSTKQTLAIKEGNSHFKLLTLPADDYPTLEETEIEAELNIPRLILIQLFQLTHFALTQADIRFYLNGILLEIEPNMITAVATDGHRMAIVRHMINLENTRYRLIIPKKAVTELLKLLPQINDETVGITIGKNYIRFLTKQYNFLSKLIESRFPPYQQIIPKSSPYQVKVDRDLLKRALNRIMILANEKSHAITLQLHKAQLTIVAYNQQNEEATETLTVQTESDELSISLNGSYLLEVLNYITSDTIVMFLKDANTSILIEPLDNPNYQYMIMPMKI